MADFKEGEIVVDLKTGKQFRVEGGGLDLDPKDYGRIEGKFTSPPSVIPEATAKFNAEEKGMTQAEFTQARQKASAREISTGAEQAKQYGKKAAAVAIPVAAGAASLIPGVGPVAGATIAAGGTAWNQVLGLEPNSPMEIFKAGAIPFLAQGAVSGVKGVAKAAGKLINPGVTRTAGVEAGTQRIGAKGATANVVNRAYTTPASKALFQEVAGQGDVATAPINDAIDTAIQKINKMANPSKTADDYLGNLLNKYRQTPNAKYEDVVEEMQALRLEADKAFGARDKLTGIKLNETRAAILDELDKVSPAIKQANAQYRREQTIEKVSKVLSNPRPDVKLGELFLNDPLVKGVIPLKDARFLENVGRQIATMGTQASPYSGVTAKAWNFLTTPVAAAMATKTGRMLLRQTFKDGKVTVPGLAVVGQFMRAYEASGADDQE